MPEKKLRGIPRRLRAIQRWPQKISRHNSPDLWCSSELYWNWKIPVLISLVQGRYATAATRRACAQGLIDAAAQLLAHKPVGNSSARVTCAICLPNMFTSEVCVYLNEDYFTTHVGEGTSIFGERRFIHNRKLSSEWALRVPPGMGEVGIAVEDLDDDGRPFSYECWYFGEVV